MRQSINEKIPLFNPTSPISESYRTLRTNIQFSSIEHQMKVLMVTSATRGEGRTTTVGNLAIAYAKEGKKVLLIDADSKNPTLHQVFTMANRVGLSSVLAGQNNWREVVKETNVQRLSLITSGPDSLEMLGSDMMRDLLIEWREQYDIILFDTPPVLAATDGLVVSTICDGVVMVVIAGKVDRELVKKAKVSLEHVNARLIGVVFNQINRKNVKAKLHYTYGK
ncbi:CpsD/CapB family tyrosine-protein kinase [Paenibacillus mendelii]|uniref:non-specific protein-tyrosine kinase n=1 Tax=Paenibacillus mendelii TaxID=206163 RepID=A0ABV6JJV5_9BACL|nr:CpsD/CapB family tyrosine-protein kinase [Paenibacillus mendelii]MCQ6558902.1 CpsD/CapB family tyrosine-protein kinase [Paenibacillus mendelii]